jgi:primase-polymerase (primpol)-like protein
MSTNLVQTESPVNGEMKIFRGTPPRPVPDKPHLDNVPAYMRELPHWCGFKFVQNKEKWGKLPVDIHTGKGASCTNLDTLCTFDEARKAFEGKRYGLDGIGFSVSFSDIVFVDIDHCYNAWMEPDARAQKLLAELDSYAEVSVSKTGLHILCRGVLDGPEIGSNPSGIEMYARVREYQGKQIGGRFVWITGRLHDADVSSWKVLRCVNVSL